MINSSNFDTHLYKHILYKYCPRFVKAYKIQCYCSSNKFDIDQFLVLLFDCVTNIKHLLSIDNRLKNPNILWVETGKNPTTALYSTTTKPEIFWIKRRL